MTGLLEQLLSTPAWLVLLVVFALPALESSAFLGFIFPGETAVLLGGVAASQGQVPLPAVVLAGVGGAILGDAVGYVVGRRWGRRILGSTLGRFTNASHLERAERALIRRGGWAVFIGRFTVALRVMIPGLAGMARMPYRRFLRANVAGGAAWGGAHSHRRLSGRQQLAYRRALRHRCRRRADRRRGCAHSWPPNHRSPHPAPARQDRGTRPIRNRSRSHAARGVHS